MAITRTPIIDDDGTGTTGTSIDNAWKQQLYDQIDALTLPYDTARGPWVAYTPSWANSGGAVSLGNGSIAGRWLQNGKTVHFVMGMVTGTTTTYGPAGIYAWGLPAQPFSIIGLTTYLFTVGMLNQSGGATIPFGTYAFSGPTFYCVSAAGGVVGPTVPFTWVANCSMVVRGTFDVA